MRRQFRIIPGRKKISRQTIRLLLTLLALFALAAAQYFVDDGKPDGVIERVAEMIPGGRAVRDFSSTISGGIYVVDGDSLKRGKMRMRIMCYDAVELHQTCSDARGANYACGQMAKDALAAISGAGDLRCAGEKEDVYRRRLVNCTAGGRDVAAEMVEQGWAVADCVSLMPREAEAHAAKRGIWQGEFMRPKEWRRGHPWRD